MISTATTGAVINTKMLINTSWITRRDCVTVKYSIDASRIQPAPRVMEIAGPWMRW